jgi:hypothetical protein
MKTTKSGKLYEVVRKTQAGFGVTGRVTWEIASTEVLSYADVEEIIEATYPHAGYGGSVFRRLQKLPGRPFEIEVQSNASCD